MRACLACVWERSEILSSHPSKPTEKRDQVSDSEDIVGHRFSVVSCLSFFYCVV